MPMKRRKRFWDLREDGDDAARLVISGTIDSGQSWYEDAVTPAMLRADLDACEGMALTVEINSPGGDIFAGYEIYNMLRARTGATRVLVTGMAASAASVVAMAADEDELAMCECSMMMVHNPWTLTAGNAEVLRDEAEVLDLIRDTMLAAYMRRYKGNEDEMRALLDAETYLTPERAVEAGLADRIERMDGAAAGGEAAAGMLGRYAAMDVSALRRRLAGARCIGRAAHFVPSVDDLMAAGLQGACGPVRVSGDQGGDPGPAGSSVPAGSNAPAEPTSLGQVPPDPRRDYLSEADAILARLDAMGVRRTPTPIH